MEVRLDAATKKHKKTNRIIGAPKVILRQPTCRHFKANWSNMPTWSWTPFTLGHSHCYIIWFFVLRCKPCDIPCKYRCPINKSDDMMATYPCALTLSGLYDLSGALVRAFFDWSYHAKECNKVLKITLFIMNIVVEVLYRLHSRSHVWLLSTT